MKYFFLLLLTYISLSANSQNDNWYPFEVGEEENALIGYKDVEGNVMIKPRFKGFLMSRVPFTDIIAVEEEVETERIAYYLSKDGQKFGQDSMYVFDMAFDCEREGFIRFQPDGWDRTGLFNRKGEIVIPPDYNYISEVNNGLVFALKDARKEYWDKNHDENGGCDHWSWVDGIECLLDTANNVLIENFKYNPHHDFHSIRVEDVPSTDTLRDSYLGVNGKYYTFINNEKAFKYWFFNEFLKDLSEDRLKRNSFKYISWQDNLNFGVAQNEEFIDANYELIKDRISEILRDDCEYFMSLDGYLNSRVEYDNGYSFDDYFDNCGNLKFHRYPKFDIIVNYLYKNEVIKYQDHFNFLKTDGEYKLIGLTLREADFEILNDQ